MSNVLRKPVVFRLSLSFLLVALLFRSKSYSDAAILKLSTTKLQIIERNVGSLWMFSAQPVGNFSFWQTGIEGLQDNFSNSLLM